MLDPWSSNRKLYQKRVEEVGCTRYQPCPICLKCMVKASHIHIKCQRCEIPICGHDERARNFMIRRDNFTDKLQMAGLTKDVGERFRAMEESKRPE